MVDTVRTLAALQALLADNTDQDISAQDVRDFLVSVYPASTTYTPTWSTTGTAPALGNGTLEGQSLQLGTGTRSLVFVQLLLEFGSTTSAGSGSWRFDWPVAPLGQPTGLVQMHDSGTGFHLGSIKWASSSLYEVTSDDGIGFINASRPFTWTTGDQMFQNFFFFAA